MWPLTLLLAFLLGLFLVRFQFSQPPQLRQKPGESVAEARLILQGTYRVYTWLTWVVVATSIGPIVEQEWPQSFLGLAYAALQILWLLVARAVYWRLGYDLRRTIFLVGHLTILFPLSEVVWALPRDLRALFGAQEQTSLM